MGLPRFFFFGMCAVVVLGTSCDKPEVSSYWVPKEDKNVLRPDGLAAWEVPEAWLGRRSKKPELAAFLIYDDSGRFAKMTISNISGEAGSWEANIARWARQLGVAPPTDEVTEDIEIDGYPGRRITLENSDTSKRLEVTWVEHAGNQWFFKLIGPASATRIAIRDFENLTAAVRFDQIPPVGLKTWRIPVGWRLLDPRPSQLALLLPDSSSTAKIVFTVSAFPGDVGGLPANVIRWARQIELEPPDEHAIPGLMTSIDVDGNPAQRVNLVNPKLDYGLQVVVVKHAGQSWFFKIVGRTADMIRAQDSFKGLIQSIRFDEGKN